MFPSIIILPELGVNSPSIKSTKVVLPEPVLPVIPIKEPAFISKCFILKAVSFESGYLNSTFKSSILFEKLNFFFFSINLFFCSNSSFADNKSS